MGGGAALTLNPSSPAFQWIADLIGILGLLGLFWRFVIRPHFVKFLQDTVVDPLGRVEHSLTQNGGKNNPATVPDKFHEVFKRLDQQDEVADRREARAEAWRDEHTAWSNEIRFKIDERLSALEDKETK